MPPARPREGAAEAPVPWFPRRKRGPGRRASAEAKRGPGTRGRGAARAGPRLAPLPPPPRVPDPAARVLTGSRWPRGRAAERRGAGAHGRLPGGSGFSAAPRPELLSRAGRRPPSAPRAFAYSAARLPPWPARGPSPGCGRRASGGWVPAGFWGASGGEGGSPAHEVAEARDRNDLEERARRSTRVGDARPPRPPPRSPPPTPACGEPAGGFGNHGPRGLICGKKRNRSTYVFGTHLGRGPSLPVRVGVSLLGLPRKLSTVPRANLTSPPFETTLDSGGF